MLSQKSAQNFYVVHFIRSSMLSLISPAKTLDFESPDCWPRCDVLNFPQESQELIGLLKKKSVSEIQNMMLVSENIAKLNVERFNQWKLPFGPEARTALQAFKGDVYEGMDAQSLSLLEVKWLNEHLYIISGLYGLLRPLQAILPYRLEMSTKIPNKKGGDLYAFWGNKITDLLNNTLTADGIVLNLASQEYYKAIKSSLLKAIVVTPDFRELKGGEYKVISFYAKRARGLMMQYIAKNRIDHPEGILDFSLEGYKFNSNLSQAQKPVFTRDTPV